MNIGDSLLFGKCDAGTLAKQAHLRAQANQFAVGNTETPKSGQLTGGHSNIGNLSAMPMTPTLPQTTKTFHRCWRFARLSYDDNKPSCHEYILPDPYAVTTLGQSAVSSSAIPLAVGLSSVASVNMNTVGALSRQASSSTMQSLPSNPDLLNMGSSLPGNNTTTVNNNSQQSKQQQKSRYRGFRGGLRSELWRTGKI